ncbi:hypothetical protein [Actinoplanes couchii]|uniref:Lipoprotein n=1 Tax=Actinoplanes couchii TaxID=403638 RepID=A0ABQ3XFT1_9ACTN|nr:hypothetical protein [Actinoplanes couchii]MDR6321693.1 hypothetical protein [Actinoplanes couchii]GID57351.1 lipoprotein [Actinoplanes couchii]
MRLNVLAATLVLLLSGCGGGDSAETSTPAASPEAPDNGVSALAADEILKRANTALAAADSYRMTGRATEQDTTVEVDVAVSGEDFKGTLSFSDTADVEVMVVGGKQYMKPNKAFWSTVGFGAQADTIAAKLGDRWILVPARDKTWSGLFGFGDADAMLKPDGKVSKGETTAIAFTPVVVLNDGGSSTNKLYIATTGEPYPVLLGDLKGDRLEFSDFGASFPEITAPAAGDYVKQADLGR